MDVDPAASLRCWAIDIELGGQVHEIPALPAADWWPIVSEGNVSAVLDLVPADLDEALLSGAIGGDEMITALTDALEQAAGRPMHAAVVLAMAANSQWPIVNGHLVTRGFRWDQQSLGAALDAVHAFIVGALDKEAREKFLALLEDPKDKTRAVGEFETMAGPRPTGGVRSTAGPSGDARPRTRTRRPQRPPADRLHAPTPPRGRPAGSGPRATT